MDAKAMKGLDGLETYVKNLPVSAGWGSLADFRASIAAKALSTPWPAVDQEEWRRSSIKGFDFDTLDWGATALKAVAAGSGVPSFVRAHVDEFGSQAGDGLVRSDFSALAEARLDQAASGQPAFAVSATLDPALKAAGLEMGFAGVDTFSKDAVKAFESLLAEAAGLADNRFQYWHLAAADAVLCLYIPKNMELSKEVVIDWHFGIEDRGSNVLILVAQGSSSKVRILERQESRAGFFLNIGRYASQGENSGLAWDVFQDLHPETVLIGHGHGLVKADARHALREAQLGAGWIKSRHGAELRGEGSQAILDGIYFGSLEQHVDLRTVQNHVSPRAWSRAVYRGVVKDEARAIYQGLIHVDPHAPKTDAFMSNKNLILNDGARADSIPSLNIETDDVKCSHGSTTGRIDPEEVFYLQNRGFSPKDAEDVLVAGFLDEVINQMSSHIKSAIQDRISQRIQGA